MSISLWVGNKSYKIGSASFLKSFFSTIYIKLEDSDWGGLYPVIMNEFYMGKLSYKNCDAAINEILKIRDTFRLLSPEHIVWDFENPIYRRVLKMFINRDNFEYWLANMDEELSSFFTTISSDLNNKLDYSHASLLALEAWLLKSYSNVEEIMLNNQKLTLDRLSRYIGETFRKCFGGNWNINIEDKRDVYYQIPVIEWKHNKIIFKECPVSLVTASVDRRTGDYIYKVLQSHISRVTRIARY